MRSANRHIFWVGIAFALCLACERELPAPLSDVPELDPTPYDLYLPQGFPEPTYPADNPLTRASVALGKRLFYDTALSRDSTISCNSCHLQTLAFGAASPLSAGVEDRLGKRNSPPLFNLAYAKIINWDGGVPKLDLQALVPIEDMHEMDFRIDLLADRLNADTSYLHAFHRAYGQSASAFTITRALGSFLRILMSGDSAFDRARRGEAGQLSRAAREGARLFFGPRLSCPACHVGTHLNDSSFVNNALYLDYPDPGRSAITLYPADAGKFRVPSLRNVALTAPYMHDGSFHTLEAVIDHYASGGQPHPNRDIRMRPFDITPTETANLIAFLEALTDSTFVRNVAYQ